MAHAISIRENGIVEAAYAEKPWHGLGFIANRRMSPSEALNQANLDWTVSPRPLFVQHAAGDYVEIDDKRAIVRDDTCVYLGTVGTRYVPIQNREQCSFIEAVVGEGSTVEAVGALFGGKKIFWTLKLPGKLVIGKKDDVEKFLILMNAHDGSKSFIGFWSPIRVVCNNTLTAAMTDVKAVKDGFSIRHTANAKERIEQARQTLGIAKEYYERLGDTFLQMRDKKIELPQFNDFLLDLVPVEQNDKGIESIQRIKMRDTIRLNWSRGIGANLAGNTAWGAFNAVTLYTSHQRIPSAKRDNRFESVMYGSSRALAQKAFDLSLALCN